jgi:aspartyl-tRNA(Asn)/glutamyl-tRNA(Gln) amidotransferase subunit C
MLALAMPAAREDFPIARVAALARLRLSPADAVLYQAQLDQSLAFLDRIAAAEIHAEAPGGGDDRAPVIERPDEAGPSLAPEAALANAPDTTGERRLVRVPRVIG